MDGRGPGALLIGERVQQLLQRHVNSCVCVCVCVCVRACVCVCVIINIYIYLYMFLHILYRPNKI